jgi:hypothetical protein
MKLITLLSLFVALVGASKAGKLRKPVDVATEARGDKTVSIAEDEEEPQFTFTQYNKPLPLALSHEQTAEFTAPVTTVGIDEANAVFDQLMDDIRGATTSFESRTRAVLTKVNIADRNTANGQFSANLYRDLDPSYDWSYFTYNCASKVAVPIFRVQPCSHPALLQITDFLANGDAYFAYGNDQLILKTPRVRSLGPLTLSFDPSSAMISKDWSHGEVPIESRTAFTLKIVPREVTYETGRGAVRLLPLNFTSLTSRIFAVTTALPYDQAADACAAFGASLTIFKNDRQLMEVAKLLNKLPGSRTVWFGGVKRSKPVSRLYMLFNPVTEQVVIDRVPRTDSTYREVLCSRK